MDKKDYTELAKTFSKDILFDILINQRISEDEFKIYMNEIKSRGLENELAETNRNNDNRKNRYKDSVKELSKENLFNTIIYNIDRYSEEDLNIFKKEVENRGFGNELSDAIQIEDEKRKKFRSVLNNSKDLEDLMNNFIEHSSIITPDIEHKVKKKIKKESLKNIVIGIVILLIGTMLSFSMDGEILFFGAILVGTFLLVKGIIIMVKNK